MAHPDSAAGYVDGGNGLLDADELDAADIAAAMGFSSFGSQAHPNKKRRFNPRADAVVAYGGGRSATGSNAVPLAPSSSASAGATEEGEDDDDEQEREPQYVDTSRPVGEVRRLGEAIEGEGDDAAVQARIDAILAAGSAAYGMAVATTMATTTTATTAETTAAAAAVVTPANQLDGSAVSAARRHNAAGQRIVCAMDRHGFRPDLAAAPPRAECGSGSSSGSHGAPGGYGRSAGHGGGQQSWWADYYDPTSNENPWARLEEGLGVPARGSWLAGQGPRHRGPGSAANPPSPAAPAMT